MSKSNKTATAQTTAAPGVTEESQKTPTEPTGQDAPQSNQTSQELTEEQKAQKAAEEAALLKVEEDEAAAVALREQEEAERLASEAQAQREDDEAAASQAAADELKLQQDEALTKVSEEAQEAAQSRWDAADANTAPEVQVMINTLSEYSRVMSPTHRCEVDVGAVQQTTLFRTLLHVIGYASGEHFVASMNVLMAHIAEHSKDTFSHRLLFRYLNERSCMLSLAQRQEFSDLFTVLTAVAVAKPGERALISKSFDLERTFRCVKNEEHLQRMYAYYKRFCNID